MAIREILPPSVGAAESFWSSATSPESTPDKFTRLLKSVTPVLISEPVAVVITPPVTRALLLTLILPATVIVASGFKAIFPPMALFKLLSSMAPLLSKMLFMTVLVGVIIYKEPALITPSAPTAIP